MKSNPMSNKYLWIMIAAVLISTLYWSFFSIHSYNTYHVYGDVGIEAYDMYYHIHYPSIVHGLQYLVFAQHVAPDQLFVMLAFFLAPSALTLLIIQATIISLTGLVVFLIARDLLKSEKTAMLLGLAFLLNPGIWGLLIFDYHAEMLIPLFFLLTFYSIVKNRKYLFAASLLLLLGTLEIAPFVAVSLGLSMALYALIRTKDKVVRGSWLRYSGAIILSSIIMFLVYGFITGSLNSAYRAGHYAQLPTLIMDATINSGQFSQIGLGLSNYGVISQLWYFRSMDAYFVYALMIIFIGFGIACLFDPLFALLFVSPWLFEALIVGNTNFLFVWYQYFSYAMAGAVCITILSLRSIKSSEIRTTASLLRYVKNPSGYLILSIPICIAIICFLYPHFVYSINVNSFKQDFLFQTNSSQTIQVQRLNSIISLVPKNGSIMAPYFASSRLFARQYFELLPAGPNATMVNATSKTTIDGTWFQPEYVLGDFNDNISLNSGSDYQLQDFENITANGYSLYAQNGTAMLFKKNS